MVLRYGIFAIGPAERQTDCTPEQFSFCAERREAREGPRTGSRADARPRAVAFRETGGESPLAHEWHAAWGESPSWLPLLLVDEVDRNPLCLEAIEIGLERRVDRAELGIQRTDSRVVAVALEHEDAA